MGNADKFELVTGHGPEPHVDADDHALLYASFIGSGVYRMTGVKTSEIEVTSENEVTISPGMFLIHGRFCRVKDSIALAIETGSQGQNRNDLVVAEYSYSGNETEIDDIELVVVTGTPANPGSETDPSIEDDLTLFDIEYGGSITEETTVQIPLWRVPREGLTTQDPVALFEDYVDASTARTSIDQLNKQTLVDIQNKHKVTYEVKAGIVTVRGASLGDSSTGGTNAGGSKNVDIGTMPEGLRPSEETFFYLSGRGGSTGNQANKIMPNGTIRLHNTSSSINWWSFTCVYPVG